MSEVIVTKLQHDPDTGHVTAHVSANGRTLAVAKRNGSWLAYADDQRTVSSDRRIRFDGIRDLPHAVAAELQDRLPATTRKVKA